MVTPCGPCLPPGAFPTPFGGPGSGLWPSGSGGAAGGEVFGPVGVIEPPTPAPRQGPDPVPFGTAGIFKILAQSGISNVPTSSIIGNMGVSPIAAAAITGFALVLDGSGQFSTSSQVSGLIYAADYAPPTPAMLTQAVLDMQTAYTNAAGRTPNFVNVMAGILSGVFVPGVYKWTTGVVIPTTIILAGGPDDTWIFQIDGTLMVAPGAQILLVGGAQARNIVWQVAGAVTVGPAAAFNGNILAQTSIAIQTGASVIGRLLSQTAVALDNNFVNGI